MLAGAHDDIKIAGRSAELSGVAFTAEADALAVARARLDANGERFSAADHALAVAEGAGVLGLARAAAARALDVEAHVAGDLGDLALAIALGTGLRALQEPF